MSRAIPAYEAHRAAPRDGVAGAADVVLQARPSGPGATLPDLGHRHLDTVTTPRELYNFNPPTSGPHLPNVAPWAFTRAHSRRNSVHLEDGGVVVQYTRECPDIVARLRTIVEKYPDHVILSSYPTLKSPIALTAWTRIDTLADLDDYAVSAFIDANRGIHRPSPSGSAP